MYRHSQFTMPPTFTPLPSEVANAFSEGKDEYIRILTEPSYGYFSLTNKNIPEDMVILKEKVSVKIYTKHYLGTQNHYGYEQYNTHIYNDTLDVYAILTKEQYKKMLEDYSIEE